MFDYLRCDYPLPVAGANALEYQTKSTDAQFLDKYEIREDGTLWHFAYEPRMQEDAEAPMGFWMHRDNERWEHDAMTGEIVFTAYPGDVFKEENRVTFSAYFVRGELKHLEHLKTPNV